MLMHMLQRVQHTIVHTSFKSTYIRPSHVELSRSWLQDRSQHHQVPQMLPSSFNATACNTDKHGTLIPREKRYKVT